MRRRLRTVLLVLATGALGMAVLSAAAGGQSPAPPPGAAPTDPQLAQQGRTLFEEGCATCHGDDLRGRKDMGPSLIGAGAAAADFYLSTGRMPIDNPTDQPVRGEPTYSKGDIARLVAYIGSFGGPAIPRVDAAAGDLRNGLKVFTERCAGCHQVVAKGGIVTGGAVPALDKSTPTQVGEAVRVGPYLMSKFDDKQIDQRTLNDLAAYVRWTRHPDNAGGWGIGNIGPIPEGMVAWLLGAFVLAGVARVIGERSPS